MSVLNLNDADKLYYGNTEVEKLYKGNELLYPLVGGNFSPLDLSPALWLDANDSSTLTLVSGAVSEWRDKSGNNRHATQTNASNRPLLVANGLNGTDVINFTSNKFWLDGQGLNLLDDCSIFICFKLDGWLPNDVDNIGFIFTTAQNFTQSNSRHFQLITINTNIFRLTSRTTSSSTIVTDINSNNNWNILNANVSFGNEQSLSLNGDTSIITPNNLTRDTIGDVYRIGLQIWETNTDFQFWGKISQIIIFPRVLTTAEREQLEGYLAHKTGLTANLPSNHPYKNIAP